MTERARPRTDKEICDGDSKDHPIPVVFEGSGRSRRVLRSHDPDPSKAKRAADAMLKMVKLDIAALKAAYSGTKA